MLEALSVSFEVIFFSLNAISIHIEFQFSIRDFYRFFSLVKMGAGSVLGFLHTQGFSTFLAS
jgi:hypothetical protein